MKNIVKKITSVVIALVMLSTMAPTAMAGIEKPIDEAYAECAALYPEFVGNVKAAGVNDSQIITFLESVQQYLIELEIEITEENFEEYIFDGVNYAISLRKNIKVRNALVKAYPDAVVDGVDGVINPEFIPLVETIKAILFGNEEEIEPTEKETEPTEEETEPTTEKETDKATEPATEKETDKATEPATEKETDKATEPATEKETDKATEPATEKETDKATEPATEKETDKATEPAEKETEKPTKPESGGMSGGVGGGDEGEETPEDEASSETKTDETKPTEPIKETTKTKFSDMNQAAWAEEAVMALVDMGVISGYPDGTFLPNKSITRAEFAKIIVVASGRYSKDAQCKFEDVPKDQWYYSYVASAFEVGFITGRDEKTFDPNSNITRADLCLIAYRFIKSINSEFKATAVSTFTDADKIPAWTTEAVNALSGAGIVGGMGDGKFEPLAPATRAQSAKIIYGAIKAALGQ